MASSDQDAPGGAAPAAQNGGRRVTFDARLGKSMTFDEAEQLVQAFYEQHRETFAVHYARIMTGVDVRRPIHRKRPQQ